MLTPFNDIQCFTEGKLYFIFVKIALITPKIKEALAQLRKKGAKKMRIHDVILYYFPVHKNRVSACISLIEEHASWAKKRDICERLLYFYIIEKLYTNEEYIKDRDIFVKLFYRDYIHMIRKEVFRKYGIDYREFKNYKELYSFLKEKGYVALYYDIYRKKIRKRVNSKNFYIGEL